MKQWLIALSLAVTIPACSLIDAITHEQELTVYAENLFRRQNELTSELMMLDSGSDDENEIYQAELRMHEACKLLNDYAQSQMEGKSMGILFKRRVKNSLPACDDAIQDLEDAIEDAE